MCKVSSWSLIGVPRGEVCATGMRHFLLRIEVTRPSPSIDIRSHNDHASVGSTSLRNVLVVIMAGRKKH